MLSTRIGIQLCSVGLMVVWAGSAAAQEADDDAGVPLPAADVSPDQPLEAAPATGVEPAVPTAEFKASAVATNPFVTITPDELPRNAQRVTTAELANRDGPGLNQALNARLGSAVINDVQNNPLQPDFQYRGFTASPLLGTPQGIAVYQNGVRVNEAFGDVLQWDLLPTFAIAEAAVVPGADPIYGLNALGGSLVLHMKNGFRTPGLRLEALGGSFSRYQTIAEYGYRWGDWALYVGGSLFGEQGWRDHSDSSAQNAFFDVRHRESDREVGVSTTLANTRLLGNGPAPTELLSDDRYAVYTWPDITQNRLVMVNVDAKQRLGSATALLGMIYFRHGQRNTVNGDEAEFGRCEDDDTGMQICTEDGDVLRDESGEPFLTNQLFNAVYNRTRSRSDGFGGTVQLSVREKVASRPNNFIAGASYDGSHTEFLQRTELGRLTLDRGVQGSGLNVSGDLFRTDLAIQSHALGVFASDTWRVAGPLALQASARLNVFDTRLDDQQGTALDGHHTFARVNPSIGLVYDLAEPVSLFASYGESNRAPSAAELTCADPDEPCRLPNAFISDPPLEQVVSRSVEVGLRTRLGTRAHPWLQGSLGLFGTRNADDILFVAGSRVGTGYFRNAGTTQRLGLEAAVAVERGPIDFYASYTLLRATFEDDLELPGTANPYAEGGGDDDDDEGGSSLEVEKGSRIPGLPTHAVKAGFSVRPIPALELGVTLLGQSSQPFRGDEGNYLAGVRGFVVLGAHASYQLLDQLELYVRANNLLNTRYSTFGVLADPSEVFPNYSNPRFLGPGAPLGVWVGAVVTEMP